MLAKLSTRRYQHGLKPVSSQVEQTATGTSKSAVSRRFVAATEQALGELLAQELSTIDLVALLVDGIHVAERHQLYHDRYGHGHPHRPVPVRGTVKS
jgi:hypothetical protein